MAVVLPSGGSLLGVKLIFLINLPFWSDDVIMMLPASLGVVQAWVGQKCLKHYILRRFSNRS